MRKKGYHSRHVSKIELRRRIVSDAYRSGCKTAAEIREYIADHWPQRPDLLAGEGTIRKDLQHLQERWRQISDVNIAEANGTLRSSINERRDEAREAWHFSKRPKTTKATKVKQAGAIGKDEDTVGTESERSHKVEQTAGDPRFLDQWAKCDDQEAKLLGLYPSTSSKKDETHLEALARMIGVSKEDLAASLSGKVEGESEVN
jgi:hypothetical protein